MTEDEQVEWNNLRGEVDLLRELVALLLAQLPGTQAKLDTMQTAFRRACRDLPEQSPQYMSVACAWHLQIERAKAYERVE